MFLEFYGLREQPFGVTPDPRYLFLSQSHREALASLFYAIESKRGFSAIVAEPGMGKTSLIFSLMDSLKNSTRTAFLFQSQADSRAFLRSVLHDSGISCSGQEDLSRMHQMLNETLVEESRAGRQFILLLDEAQNLSDELLESIRILSNFETPSTKLIHIILAGQSSLAAKLARPELLQLRQRVSSTIKLSAFSFLETCKYIDHRLHVAGHRGDRPFSDEALGVIHRFSDGVPRNINNICFQALSLGFANDRKTVDAKILSEVLCDMGISVANISAVPQPAVAELPSSPAASSSWLQPQPQKAPQAAKSAAPAPLSTAIYQRSHSRPSWHFPFLGLVAVPLLAFVAFRNSDLSGVFSGRFAQHAVSATVDEHESRDRSVASTTPPELPEATKPPVQATHVSGDDLSTLATKASPELPNAVERTTSSLPKEKAGSEGQLPNSREDSAPGLTAGHHKPRIIYARRPETVFQIALEYYGKVDRTIIRSIGSVNPALQDPYQIVQEGQRIVLPDVSSDLSNKSKATVAMSTESTEQ